MEKETREKLLEGRDALQDNILPEKYEVIELYDLINVLDTKAERYETALKRILRLAEENHIDGLDFEEEVERIVKNVLREGGN